MLYRVETRPDVGPKRPVKIKDESGKCVATTTTVAKGVAAARRANEAV